MRGERAWRNVVLGEGQISPPDCDAGASMSSLQADHLEHVDWEGHVRCDSNVSIGGFNAGTVTVKVRFFYSLSLMTSSSPCHLGLYRFGPVTSYAPNVALSRTAVCASD